MRLIDADELMEHVWRDKLDSRELIAKMIDDAPTVKEISTKIPINVFEQLISQEPKTRHWIPVSERLPEKTGLYLISIGDLVTTGSFDGHNFRTQAMVRFVPDAWMPLPKPYKPTDSEKE